MNSLPLTVGPVAARIEKPESAVARQRSRPGPGTKFFKWVVNHPIASMAIGAIALGSVASGFPIAGAMAMGSVTLGNRSISMPEQPEAIRPKMVSSVWRTWVRSRMPDSDLLDRGFNATDTPVVPNFSYAGYKSSEEPLPSLQPDLCDTDQSIDSGTGYSIINVKNYGAIPDDQSSDKEAVRKAIGKGEQMISEGAAKGIIVLFPEGVYRMNEQSDMEGITLDNPDSTKRQSVRITQSHMILRGCGEKSILHMEEAHLPRDPRKKYSAPRLFIIGHKTNYKIGKIIQPVTAETSKELIVSTTRGLKPGDCIEISAVITNMDRILEYMGPYPIEKSMTMLKKGLDLREIHTVVAIDGDKIVLAEPVQVNINPEDGWVLYRSDRTEEIGVENMTLRGRQPSPFRHHRSALYDSGWGMLQFIQSRNCWVRNVTLESVSVGIKYADMAYSTVKDILVQGSMPHFSLDFGRSFNCLSVHVADKAGSWHGPGVSHYSSSNVHLDSVYYTTSTPNIHASQPRNSLFDRMYGGWILTRWGGAVRNQPNHLDGLVFWNPTNTGYRYTGNTKYRFMKEGKFGRIVVPVVVGMHGPRGEQRTIVFARQQEYFDRLCRTEPRHCRNETTDELQAWTESNGQEVLPSSLFLAQLTYRFFIADPLNRVTEEGAMCYQKLT